jgi:hypothetical protein
MKILRRLAIAFVALQLSACVYYEPVPVQSTFDQAWSAAVGGAQDAGVGVTSADRGMGVIRGRKPPMDVTITLRTRADGGVQVEINAKGGSQAEEGELTRRISDAYNRRMGR